MDPLNAAPHQDEEESGQQAEEAGGGRQEEGRALLDTELVGRAAGDAALMGGELLQGVQHLDPHQVHRHDDQQAHASETNEDDNNNRQ